MAGGEKVSAPRRPPPGSIAFLSTEGGRLEPTPRKLLILAKAVRDSSGKGKSSSKIAYSALGICILRKGGLGNCLQNKKRKTWRPCAKENAGRGKDSALPTSFGANTRIA